MPFPNPLLRSFANRLYDKAFDHGLLLGSFLGVFLTHFYYQDKMKKIRRW